MNSSDIFRRKNNRSTGCVDNNRHIRTSGFLYFEPTESDERLTRIVFLFVSIRRIRFFVFVSSGFRRVPFPSGMRDRETFFPLITSNTKSNLKSFLFFYIVDDDDVCCVVTFGAPSIHHRNVGWLVPHSHPLTGCLSTHKRMWNNPSRNDHLLNGIFFC